MDKNKESYFAEIILKKSFLEIEEGHIGMYELKFNNDTNQFEALVPVDKNKQYNIPEDFFEENNPTIKIVD